MGNINVGGRLHSAATGNVLAGANEILDDEKGKKQSVVNAEVDEHLATHDSALADRYTKSETYSKSELDNLITTPEQEYVTVTATDQTTAVTDLLPASGSADTVYRVGNWDGSQYDTTKYTEYAWDGTQYVPLDVKEVGIDDEPTAGSDNLVKSEGIWTDDEKIRRKMSRIFNNEYKLQTNIAFTQYNVYTGSLTDNPNVSTFFRATAPIYVEDGYTNVLSVSNSINVILCYSDFPHAGDNPSYLGYMGSSMPSNAFLSGTKYIVIGFDRNQEVTEPIDVVLYNPDTYSLDTKIFDLYVSSLVDENRYNGNVKALYTEYNTTNGVLSTVVDNGYKATSPIYVEGANKIICNDARLNVILYYSGLPTQTSNYIGVYDKNAFVPATAKYAVLGLIRYAEINIGDSIEAYADNSLGNHTPRIIFDNHIAFNEFTKNVKVVYNQYNVITGVLNNEGGGQYKATSPIYVEGASKIICNDTKFNVVLFYSDYPLDSTTYISYGGQSAKLNIPSNAKYAVIGLVSYAEINIGDSIEAYVEKSFENYPSRIIFDNQIAFNEFTKNVKVAYNQYNANTGVLNNEGNGQYKATSPINVQGATCIICDDAKFNVVLFYSDYPLDSTTYISYGGQSAKLNIPSNAKYAVIGLVSYAEAVIGDIIVAYSNNNLSEKQSGGKRKQLWTLWDSLGENTWQQYLMDSKLVFNKTLNTLPEKPISYGGTTTDPSIDNGGQARAINLVSYKGTYPIDIVLIENINDIGLMSNVGSITDKPFMRSQKIILSGTASSYNDAKSFVSTNLSTILSGVEQSKRKKGSIISYNYVSGSQIAGSTITFGSGASSNGDISLIWNGIIYSVHVTAGMTPTEIANEFSKYSFGPGVSDYNNNDGSLTIVDYVESAKRIISFDGGTTGVTATIENATLRGEYCIYFTGDLNTEWTEAEKWVESLSLYSIYRGFVEYLIANLPEARIYWCLPYAESINFSSNTYKNPDGTWSLDNYTFRFLSLYNVQKALCEYYNIPVIDLYRNAGMSLLNIETYFYSNNVHPKTKGYQRYADYICSYLSANCEF